MEHLLRIFHTLEKIYFCLFYILDRDWKLYGIISLSTVFIIIITIVTVYFGVKCIKILKFRHRQLRNQRQMTRNPQQIQLRLLPESVQNFSSFN